MTSTAWVIRSGRYGERDEWALENSCSGGGWREVPDLTSADSREEIQRIVDEVYAQESDGARTNAVSQLWALRGPIAVGDLLAMPMKTTREIAVGRVTSPYTYLAENEPTGTSSAWSGSGRCRARR